jgi:valine--pyruvate aminotransferase
MADARPTFSSFGERFARATGIRTLMADLGAGISGGEASLMLGGGNPARIPAMHAIFREQMQHILGDDGAFGRMLEDYAPPHGDRRFIEALARLLRREYGWSVGPSNICLTAGSQTGFFMLFNLFAGVQPDGSRRRILLPLTPEYIGYTDVGLSEEPFIAERPRIEHLSDRRFKYRVDFDRLHVGADVAAICVSRPTNPTGNVLTDGEIARLDEIARRHGVPLIIDSAYGTPFPNIIFTEAAPFWNENVVLCLSLSKLGLPSVRTGIVVAAEPVVEALASMNATINLAVSSVGPVLMQDLVESGELIRVSREVIAPFYRVRAGQAVTWLHESLQGVEYHLHDPEGSLFLWLWFPELGASSQTLYERLKARGVLVLSGHHFFPGLAGDWEHRDQCIRVNYSQPPEVVREGLRIIGEEVRKLDAAPTARRSSL